MAHKNAHNDQKHADNLKDFPSNQQNFDTPPVPEEPEAVRQRKERNEATARAEKPAAQEAAKIRELLNRPHFSEADMKAQLVSTASFLDTL